MCRSQLDGSPIVALGKSPKGVLSVPMGLAGPINSHSLSEVFPGRKGFKALRICWGLGKPADGRMPSLQARFPEPKAFALTPACL